MSAGMSILVQGSIQGISCLVPSTQPNAPQNRQVWPGRDKEGDDALAITYTFKIFLWLSKIQKNSSKICYLVHLLNCVIVVLDGGGDIVGGVLGVVEAEGLGVADGALRGTVGDGLRVRLVGKRGWTNAATSGYRLHLQGNPLGRQMLLNLILGGPEQ